jgi:hypothetical protein
MGLRAINHMYVGKEIAQRVNIKVRKEMLERKLEKEKYKENNEESIVLIVRALRVIDCWHKLL